jgi:flagellar hook protein FlgE
MTCRHASFVLACVAALATACGDDRTCAPGVGGAIQRRGALVETGGWTDVAVEGEAFLVVEDGLTRELYTRAGHLGVDPEGRLVTPEGLRVKLFPDGRPTATPSSIPVPLRIEGWPSTYFHLSGNLPASSPVQVFALADPWGTSSVHTWVRLVDGAGTLRWLAIYFTREAPDRWAWRAMVDGGELRGGVPDTAAIAAWGELRFRPDGSLLASSYVAAPWFAGAASPQPLRVDLGGTTQLESDLHFSIAESDGGAAGPLTAVEIQEGGVVAGYYGPGRWFAVGRLALATFEHPEALVRTGPHLFLAPPSCTGGVDVAPPGVAPAVWVRPGALEDLSAQP